MKVLLTNDDGIQATGLNALRKALLTVPDIELAKAICATCPVQQECLDFALKTRQEFGIWGGTTEDERRALARAARKVNVSG